MNKKNSIKNYQSKPYLYAYYQYHLISSPPQLSNDTGLYPESFAAGIPSIPFSTPSEYYTPAITPPLGKSPSRDDQ